MSKKPEARLTLADMIMEKITEKQTEIQTQFTDAESMLIRFEIHLSVVSIVFLYIIHGKIFRCSIARRRSTSSADV